MSIERKIVIGLISSTEYLDSIRKIINPKLLESQVAKLLASWCIEYYDEFGKAPGQMIEEIYMTKLKKNLVSDDLASEIEDDILPGLSDEFVDNGVDLKSLIHYSKKHFQERRLENLKNELQIHLDKGDLEKAMGVVSSFDSVEGSDETDEVIFNSPQIETVVSEALTATYEPLIKFPGALGDFWNHSFVRGGLVGLLAPEKRGKTWNLMYFGFLAAEQGRKVLFVQAGDMTRNQFIRRTAIWKTGRTDKEKYAGASFCPVKDCAKNQLNLCDKKIRESNYGVFEDRNWDIKTLRNEITMADLVEAHNDYPDYQPCYNCSEYNSNSWGAVWLKPQNIKMITVNQATKVMNDYFLNKNKNFRLLSYANGTFTTKELCRVLSRYKQKENWIPDVIIIDYADLVVNNHRTEERHKQNEVWKELRGINQETDCLMLTASQADADSYERSLLKLKNFSEDKRKYSHCTAFYGLNQDKDGREKKLGIMRINELILREDEFDVNKTVTVLQNLKKGRPIVGSFF